MPALYHVIKARTEYSILHRYVIAMTLLIGASLMQGCHHQMTPDEQNAYAADAQNEDDALNEIRENASEAAGASDAVAGLIPDANGQVPMANVQ